MPMTGLPEPLTPENCDLQNYPWMPLVITKLTKSKAWFLCKRKPDLAFYMINLWMAAWHEVPAASLEDDDEMLCELAKCDPKKWGAVRDVVMRNWVKCSDGRLYHHIIAEEAIKSWSDKHNRVEAKDAEKERQRRHRERRKQMFAELRSRGVTAPWDATTTQLEELLSRPFDITATDQKRTCHGDSNAPDTAKTRPDQTRQYYSEATPLATAPAAPSPAWPGSAEFDLDVPAEPEPAPAPPAQPAPIDARTEVWRDGLAVLRRLTGKAEGTSRALLGRLLKALGDDCAAGMAILHEAEDLRPGDPEAWLMAAASARLKRAETGMSPRREKILRAAGLWPDAGGPIVDVTAYPAGGLLQ